MNDTRDYAVSSTLFFLLGAAVGAAVVALTTPKSGPELRADIRDLGVRVKDRARKLGQDLTASAEEMADGVLRG
ncbi:MAG TPA: YtxH domain-containing protein [Holophaga sp.]|nr:YtxH domain-containing protein [Holophaga sp.]